MVNDIDITVFLPILSKSVSFVKENLMNSPDMNATGYRISSQTIANDNGIVLGSVSCLRKPADDAIELTIDLKSKDRKIQVWMGIYRSDGRVIQDIAEMDIIERDKKLAISILEIFLEEYTPKALDFLKNFLLKQNEDAGS